MRQITAILGLLMLMSCENNSGGSSIDWFAARKGYEYTMVDRVANPGVEVFLIESSEARDRLNSTDPDQDLVNIGDSVRSSISAARLALPPAYSDDFLSVDDAAALLIPNVLSLKLDAPAASPGNGRLLSDDYFDRFLETVFGTAITDGIEQSFNGSDEFPFIQYLETSE